MSVKTKIKYHNQQKKMKKNCQYLQNLFEQQKFFVDLIEYAYFSVDLVLNAKRK